MRLTQVELAGRIGMDKQNLWAIEAGKSNPQILTLVKIASGMGITVPLLLSFDFDYPKYIEQKTEYTARKHTIPRTKKRK
ncbi:MAG: helix-turn-helix transcriptional regulator [Bacteroidetes bacterium]|nr:helix-turn-helix transcriptional regulator [Bacteroidota bacterium]